MCWTVSGRIWRSPSWSSFPVIDAWGCWVRSCNRVPRDPSSGRWMARLVLFAVWEPPCIPLNVKLIYHQNVDKNLHIFLVKIFISSKTHWTISVLTMLMWRFFWTYLYVWICWKDFVLSSTLFPLHAITLGISVHAGVWTLKIISLGRGYVITYKHLHGFTTYASMSNTNTILTRVINSLRVWGNFFIFICISIHRNKFNIFIEDIFWARWDCWGRRSVRSVSILVSSSTYHRNRGPVFLGID